MHPATTDLAELDVRSLVPAQRHKLIFRRLAELPPGSAIILVNDHDPRPLHYHLQAEFPQTFSWKYLEQGPSAWRVEIGRTFADQDVAS